MKSAREAFDIAQRYWKEVPVRVVEAAREMGLGPRLDSQMPTAIAGKIVRATPGDWVIFVNANHNPQRQRFTIAHEIGHFIYHRDLLETHSGVSDTLAYRADNVIAPNPLIGPLQEWQANNFAVSFLIPDAHLRPLLGRGKPADVQKLAKVFDVTETALKIKLRLPL